MCLAASELSPGFSALFGFTIIMAINEVVKILITPKLYFKSRLNILHWILLVMVVVSFYPSFARQSRLTAEQYQMAAVRTKYFLQCFLRF